MTTLSSSLTISITPPIFYFLSFFQFMFNSCHSNFFFFFLMIRPPPNSPFFPSPPPFRSPAAGDGPGLPALRDRDRGRPRGGQRRVGRRRRDLAHSRPRRGGGQDQAGHRPPRRRRGRRGDRKSTRLNSSHGYISYAVFCLK